MLYNQSVILIHLSIVLFLKTGTASEAAQEKPWLARNLPIVTGAIAVIVGLAVLLNELGIHVPFIS